jgi:hypothetical protein
MKILMLDCETLALTPDAVVTQIGAVFFDLQYPEAAAHGQTWWPDLAEQAGRRIDVNTVMWWMQQSDHARKSLIVAPHKREKKREILAHLTKLMTVHNVETVWAKPAMFDLPLLTDYFGAKPWSHRVERDMQTIVRMYDPEGKLAPAGDPDKAHDAAYDALWQCQYLERIYGLVGGFQISQPEAAAV